MRRTVSARARLHVGMVLTLFAAAACAHPGGRPGTGAAAGTAPRPALIPWPAAVTLSTTERLTITKETVIEVSSDQADLQRVARDLAALLRPALDATLTVRPGSGTPASNAIRLEIAPSGREADEAYDLTIATNGVRIAASTPAGVFYGVQTLRQLLPWSVELRGARPHALTVPTGHIVDRPRFAWRGAMLDVARHLFGPRDVKRYIDLLLDMKYDDSTVLGLNWAGNVDLPVAYEWNPATLLPKVPETAILGVEAPLWSETLATMADVEFLAFPRLAGVAEVAWSPQDGRRWSEFRTRLGAQAPRWAALGINAYWSPKVDWQR